MVGKKEVTRHTAAATVTEEKEEHDKLSC